MDWQRTAARHLLYLPAAWWSAGDVEGALRSLRASERWPAERMRELQRQRLRKLLAHARLHVARFRNLDVRVDEPSVPLSAVLERLPCLTKSEIQSWPDEFRSTARLGRLTPKTTGGSTGVPVTIWKTRHAMRWELAAAWRGYGWAGVAIGDRQARFWGVPYTEGGRRRARLTDLVCNRYRCSAFSFRDEDMARYVQELRRFRPRYFYGYVSMLTEFAGWFRARGERAPFDLRCVVTTSEVLGEPQRRLLAETFRTRVFNEYGCGELGTVAHECEHGRLHLNAENMIVEVFDGNSPCGPGRMGELVITELNNVAMPLVRYRTGDYAAFAAEECPCGRTLPVIDRLYGRAYDFIVGRDGRRFHGEFIMYVFEEAQRLGYGIRQFQVLQEGPARFRVRLVPGSGYDPRAEDLVAERIRAQVDPNAAICFEHVQEIQREQSGKIRLIVGLPPAAADG